MKIRNLCLVLALLVSVLAASGCGRDGSGAHASQVAAKVNSDEITVYQVNSMLARKPAVEASDAAAAKRAALDKLIDLELARQKAVAEKLDRSPEVVLAIENAKTEILARAYLQRVAAGRREPSTAEVKKYYADHPELFARRYIYNIEEIGVAPSADQLPALRKLVKNARSIEELADWLKAHGVKFTEKRAVRASEQIPLDVLPRLLAMKDGEISALDAANGHLDILRIAARRAAPVDESAAAPRIRQFLANRRSSELVAAEMKRLRKAAKIEYVGEFAGRPAAAGSGVPAVSQRARSGQPVEPDIEKGVRGLH